MQFRWENLKTLQFVTHAILFVTRSDWTSIFRIQGAIVFLASDASKFITGSEIRVDGGYCAI